MVSGSPRVLVTGGAGFIGSHVCQTYRDAGWEVTALDDLSTGRRSNLPDGVVLVEEDIRSEAAADLVRGGRFDLVNHHAAQIDVRVSVARPRHDASINIDGLLNLLEAARDGQVPRFLFVSSGGAIYGESGEIPSPEATLKAPLSGYGVSKLSGEHYLFTFRKLFGMEGASLRYSNVYGPRQDPNGEAGVVAVFSSRLLEGEPLTIYGDGMQTRDYVYAGDVARANLLLTTTPLPDPVSVDDVAFNVATGEETSVVKLAETLLKAAGRDVELQHAPPRKGEVLRSCLRTEKLRALGWAPEVSLEQGLGNTYQHIAQEI
ncbi:MAG: NAD-dependent epimerase/dehydratase family protein [marine benthic group bacterium]|nr:NAD-dependent epimerase/dehydratase family protein [Gemmatimonadota bacterium]MCL7965338.1 NAD-dependent epimerase/dehydratase family protein [Gemmatimonadota bacterium]MCL7967463.1 NAD-dependent epimerase/dehydratase family protein [Gemmatimonadota bacterium]